MMALVKAPLSSCTFDCSSLKWLLGLDSPTLRARGEAGYSRIVRRKCRSPNGMTRSSIHA